MSSLKSALILAAFAAVLGAAPEDRTRNPHGPLPVACEACHTSAAWTPIRQHPEFNHNTQTAYRLTGMHAAGACMSCHTSLVFKKTAHDCASCHADLHRNQMGRDCEQCHTVRGWTPVSRFTAREHSNRFPLLGAHARVECESCHQGAANAVFTGMSTDCVTCHRRDFVSAQNPPHQNGFPLDCGACHTSMTSWMGAKFDHAAVTRFALTGAHTNLPCAACHVNGRFAGTPAACVNCHQSDLQGTTDPNHIAAAFPTDCAVCHTTATWTGAKFDHNLSKFPLTGAHVNVACAQCHTNNKFTGTPTACVGCHQAEYQNTTNPNHAAAGFSTDCTACHTTATWAGAKFDHNTVFPLTGAHASVTCAQCHTQTNYSATPRVCNGCHLPDYNKTSNPNHVQAGFPTDCAVCHSTTDWAGATFDHSKAAFPLTGAHTSVACATCHTNNNFTTIPTNCDACHLSQFQQTTNPNHAKAGFPLNCALCHSTANWTSATFDHSKTVFPLSGAHTSVACANCHVGNNYTTVPTDCYGCHKTDFTGVQNPNHIASGFPTTCATCHNTTTWAGATFNHTWFPIYTGNHARVWTTCADCHLDASNYNSFSCTACHTHSQASTDREHRGVRGYVFSPTSCYQCHPQGRE
jgi:hypothetical protein